MKSKVFLATLMCAVGAFPVVALSIKYTGVNLAGAEFGQNNLPGTYNTHYTYPTQAEVDYFRNKGLNTIRLPFRWERLQQSTNANLNAAELNRLHTFVAATTAKAVYVILSAAGIPRSYQWMDKSRPRHQR